MKIRTKVKVSSIIPGKIPKQRIEALESCIGLEGIVESTHFNFNGQICYVRFGVSSCHPFYSRELREVK